ncbi:transketolase-like protein 2 [Rhopilema esculentum]|uniref:transketolase-like protein 2 n=1 Tax=Rhopilema esculentum TaxID=499914 RepID=UPI0031CE3C40
MAEYHCPDQKRLQTLKDIANRLRIDSIQSTNAAKSGHPTSCCSIAEIMSVLFFQTMRYKVSEPKDVSSDRFVLSKGHAAPILYAAWAEAGLFPRSDLMNLRKIDCDLEGHPTPRLNFIDVATGSLGQGLSCACGMAYTGKYFDKASYRTYCIIGDGESAEGSVWEAANFASFYHLDNLVAIVDVNRLGQSDPALLQHDMETYKKRWEAFGWNAHVVDGHDVESLCRHFYEAEQVKEKPTVLICKTFKGKGIPGIEDEMNWHGKALGDKAEASIKAIESVMADSQGPYKVDRPAVVEDAKHYSAETILLSEPPSYKLGEKVATRNAYGNALAKLGNSSKRVIALDGDTKNSTFAITFQKAHPDRFIECYIAEQNLIGVGIGCGTRGRTVPFVSGFACFLSRGFDQIRMGAISMTQAKFCGSHCGVSIGEDGPSQMALEDLSMFRSIPECVVFYPSEGVSCERAVELAANHPNMVYIRSSRPATATLYTAEEKFEVGKCKVVRQSDKDVALVVGAGVTLHEALKAADVLQAEGIHIRVIDIFCLKPIDQAALVANAKACGGKVVTVEDHYPSGGLGEAVAAALSEEKDVTVKQLCVRSLPRSGPSAELMEMFGISASHIVKAVKA